jgi:hypothetical protein
MRLTASTRVRPRFCRPDLHEEARVETNFAAADTVIGYDYHGKPQNDIQAAASCITVGRAKQITLYRLITAEG